MDNVVRNAKMVVLYSEGMTYQEIGDKFGVSKQRTEQIIADQYSRTGERRRRKTDLDLIVYPVIRTYFLENERVGYASFCRKAFGHYNSPLAHKIARFFKGENVLLTITQIKGICTEVGKPFEEVFAREDGADNGEGGLNIDELMKGEAE